MGISCVSSVTLPLFIKHKLRVCALRFVGANKYKIHTCQYAEATLSAELTFKLCSEIGCAVVKEFRFHSARERIFKVDELSHQSVEAGKLWHTLDVKVVDFAYELLFERLKRNGL